MLARRPPPSGPPVPAATGAPQPAPPAAPPGGVPPPPPNIDSIPDAVPRYEPRSARGNPPFYTVLGRRYVVLGSAEGYVERGVASWYGPTFHGGNTSNGDLYDMYAMTAAHKTLPLPCYARVTNLANGRTVVVRINDRGPFVANRLIDLSYTAAARLDMLRNGTALVEVRTLTPGEPDNLTRSSATPPAALYLQAGAFADPGNAQRLQARLTAAGVKGAFVLSPITGTSRLYRVRVGPIASVAVYDQLAAQLGSLGIEARLAND
ncbi:MAG: septal ring lytic transglycosylase RlpA family protein [Proteobacteria bacterium]|nr:septal ring lytic transglycosylase RlpA family protein [Pseudomonadota bacterium]